MSDDIEISDDCQRLLADNHHGMLTTIRHSDGFPSTNPVAYTWDGNEVRISTLKSRVKYTNILANPMVAFCVMSNTDTTEYVEIRGHAALSEDPDSSFMRQQFKRVAGIEPPDDLDPPGSERVVITIEPRQVSSPKLYGGRFSKTPESR